MQDGVLQMFEKSVFPYRKLTARLGYCSVTGSKMFTLLRLTSPHIKYRVKNSVYALGFELFLPCDIGDSVKYVNIYTTLAVFVTLQNICVKPIKY